MKWKACAVAGCLRRVKARGLCKAHLERLRKTGSVQADLPILAMNMRNPGSLSRILKGRAVPGG